MKMFLDAAKRRFLPLAGWMACSFLSVIVGLIGGTGIGYLGLALGWVEYSDEMFSGLAFLVFPFVGGIVGLTVMHIVRIWCWTKLHRKYLSECEGWTRKHTVGIAFLDETIWLTAFAAICAILVTSL